jgi:thioredoxin 1
MAEEQRASRSILNDAPGQEGDEEATSAPCSCRAWWKVAVVVALLAAVTSIVASKVRKGTSPTQEPARSGVVPQAGNLTQAGPETVLATVNGEPITLAHVEEALAALPEDYRTAFERSKHDLLEELIARQLLLQEARREGLIPAAASGGQAAEADREAIRELLRGRTAAVQVTEEDLRSYYEEHKDEIPGGASFEAVRDRLRLVVQQEKEQATVESYIVRLREQAAITRDRDWVESQKALAADNPLDRALATGRPVMADFGRGSCIPCKMMAPILEDLRVTYAGRAEVLFIQVDDYPALTRRCGIRAIPTQVFYDPRGKEVSRHEGFMPREDIVAKLTALGVK